MYEENSFKINLLPVEQTVKRVDKSSIHVFKKIQPTTTIPKKASSQAEKQIASLRKKTVRSIKKPITINLIPNKPKKKPVIPLITPPPIPHRESDSFVIKQIVSQRNSSHVVKVPVVKKRPVPSLVKLTNIIKPINVPSTLRSRHERIASDFQLTERDTLT